MKKIDLKKILGIATLYLGLSNFAVAQCNASYTYTSGSNGTIYFTNTSTGISGTPSYDWNFGDGKSSHAVSPTHTYQYVGTYHANLFISDSTGSCFDSISQVITITNTSTCTIVAGFSVNAGPGVGQMDFINTTSGGFGVNSHCIWSFSDGSVFTSQNAYRTYVYNGIYSVALNVSDSTGQCWNAISQTFTVTNGNTCNLQVSDTYTLGTNGQVFFTNTSTGFDTSLTPRWTFGDGTSYQNHFADPTHTYAYNGTYYAYMYIGDSTNICSGSYTNTIVITNAATPPACGAQFTDSLFGNGNVVFINQSFGTSANAIYHWQFGNGATSSAVNPSYTYPTNGVYAVSLSLVNPSTGCSSTYSDSVIITNVTPCVPTVSYVMHKDSLNPQPGIWEISPVYSSQVTNALWFWGDGTATYGLYPTHTYAAAGQYSVCVGLYTVCGYTTTTCQNDSLYRMLYNNNTSGTNSMIQVTVVNATTGIKTNSKETAQISLYPNPGQGIVTLNLTNVLATKTQINVSNILGEVVYSTYEYVSNGSLNKSIDLQNMANGTYFVRVTAGEKSYISKIIINK